MFVSSASKKPGAKVLSVSVDTNAPDYGESGDVNNRLFGIQTALKKALNDGFKYDSEVGQRKRRDYQESKAAEKAVEMQLKSPFDSGTLKYGSKYITR